jgi:adenylate cyclase
MLVEFASAVDAVSCAMTLQGKIAEREGAILFRIGINIGDIIIDVDDIFGDGVNVAARVETECEPGGVCLSGSAFEQVRGKTNFSFDDLGERSLKNIDRPVRLYAVSPASAQTASALTSQARQPLALPEKPSIAVLPFQNMTVIRADYFCRRYGGGHHHCAVAVQVPVRHRPQFEFCLQRKITRHTSSRS